MVSPPKSERDRHKKVKGTRPFHSSTVSPPKSERDRARERDREHSAADCVVRAPPPPGAGAALMYFALDTSSKIDCYLKKNTVYVFFDKKKI
ncbi:hypothetical protein EVAR_61205_1 [Eumeta japonica]|uniref:Uncharacterized protein n=1 Tax=Eumeta variegata TaxID=151549 RepID=A0A4C1YXN7_EUMVA|nr:hypothetical protein EVAR_61205_1 [Eumeta japonica]